MAEPADINVDELRRRARRRLVGAVVLALAVAVIVPMLLETEQKPLGEDVSVKIPPIDDGKFVNRLNDKGSNEGAKGGARAPSAAAEDATTAAAANGPSPAQAPTTERAGKYDTRIPASDGAPASVAAPSPRAETSPGPATKAAEAAPVGSANAVPAATNATNATSAAKPAAAAAAHEGFAVQLAAFADDRGANALAGRLKRAGYAAYTEPLKTSKGTLWRVRVGPYPSRDAAVAARDKLKTEGQSGIVAAIK